MPDRAVIYEDLMKRSVFAFTSSLAFLSFWVYMLSVLEHYYWLFRLLQQQPWPLPPSASSGPLRLKVSNSNTGDCEQKVSMKVPPPMRLTLVRHRISIALLRRTHRCMWRVAGHICYCWSLPIAIFSRPRKRGDHQHHGENSKNPSLETGPHAVISVVRRLTASRAYCSI